MASTVPGVVRESLTAKLGIGAQAPDLSTLAAPTVSLSPAAPGVRLGQLRRLAAGKADRAGDTSSAKGDGFAATLAKALAARKSANENATRSSATQQPRVEARAERENAVRDVVRQLKQLVDAPREAKSANPNTPPKQSTQAIAHHDSAVDAATPHGVYERLAGPEAERVGSSGEDLSLSSPQEAEAQALFQTVADAIAQAMSPDGEIDEAALAAALIADPALLAAAESLIAALQAQLVTAIPAALPAIEADGEQGSESASASHVREGVSVLNGTSDQKASTTSVVSLAGGAPAPAVPVALDAAVASATGSQAGVISEAVAIVAAVAGNSTIAGEVEERPTTAPTAGSVPQATVVAGITSEADAAPAAAAATTRTDFGASNVTPETVSVVGAEPAVVVGATVASTASVSVPGEVIAAEPSLAAIVSGGEEASATAPTSGGNGDAATILSQVATGQSGTQADTSGQDLEGESRDAFSTEVSSVSASSAGVSQATSTQAGSTADADGVGAAQPAQIASVTPSTTSASPTTAAGAAAPAQRAEAVTQTPAAPDATPDVDLHEQVSPVIVRQARLVSGNGGHEMTMRLNPDHLGPLHVRISVLEGALSVALTTSSPEAQRALENALPQLRGALVESGLRLDRLDVSQRDAGNGANGQSGGQAGNQRGSANAGRGGGDQTGGAGTGAEGRQANTGNGGASFADVLLDQDGRAFGSVSRSARSMGYRAYRRA